MYKNILIIGAARSGKTTLAKKLAKEKGYNLISIDDIVSVLKHTLNLKYIMMVMLITLQKDWLHF